MKPSVLLLLSLLFLVLGSCNKQKEEPDFITCKLNGQQWTAKNSSLFSNSNEVRVEQNETIFSLKAYNESDNTTFEISLKDGNKINNGKYALREFNSLNSGYYKDYNKSYRYSYYTDSINTGLVELNFNEARTRVSGSFSFVAKYEVGDEKINITEGKFSLPLEK